MADELQVMELKEMLRKLEEGQARIDAKLDQLLAPPPTPVQLDTEGE